MKSSIVVALACALAASARPGFVTRKRAEFDLKNGQDAVALNAKFSTLTAESPCNAGDIACVNSQFAQCVGGKFVLQPCAATLVCAAVPLVNAAGTDVICLTPAERDARIAATGATASGAADTGSVNTGATTSVVGGDNAVTGGAAVTSTVSSAAPQATAPAVAGADSDPQTSLTLAANNIQDYSNDGQDVPTPGQEASQTSTNNFINFCASRPDKQPTNGKQIEAGSCNQTPMGVIAAKTKMPSAKFQSPANNARLPANQPLQILLAINNLETGHFTNPANTYHMAPQDVNADGLIKGHSHIVIERLDSLETTRVTDPTGFAYFKGLNDPAVNGVLSTTIPEGLPAGAYRIATINSAANHQPALVSNAQRGALDDMVYFTLE